MKTEMDRETIIDRQREMVRDEERDGETDGERDTEEERRRGLSYTPCDTANTAGKRQRFEGRRERQGRTQTWSGITYPEEIPPSGAESAEGLSISSQEAQDRLISPPNQAHTTRLNDRVYNSFARHPLRPAWS